MLLWGQGIFPLNTGPGTSRTYREWEHNITFLLINTTIHNNTAATAGNGGGLATENGASLVLIGCSVTNNTASLYGGGVYLDSTPNQARFDGGSVLSANSVPAGAGEQLASFSGGGLDVCGLTVTMGPGVSQVLVQGGGNVTVAGSTRFQCPAGYLFHDVYRGLYGPFATPMSEAGWTNPMLTSTLLFICTPCAQGLYTLGAGFSSGEAGHESNPACLTCPYGGVCTPGSGSGIVAQQGFWGYVMYASDSDDPVGSESDDSIFNASVVFLKCPTGYCCDGGDTPCHAIDSCAGNRTGRLCGSCPPGWGEVLGSSRCRKASQCTDGPIVWPLAVIVLLLLGGGMLRNSGVWCPRPSRPSGTLRLVSYFYQVRACEWGDVYVSVPLWSVVSLLMLLHRCSGSSCKLIHFVTLWMCLSSPRAPQMAPLLIVDPSTSGSDWAVKIHQVFDNAFTLLRFQPSDTGRGLGYCMVPLMTVGMKVSLGFVMPLAVAVCMLFAFALSLKLYRCFGMEHSSVRRVFGNSMRKVLSRALSYTMAEGEGVEERAKRRASAVLMPVVAVTEMLDDDDVVPIATLGDEAPLAAAPSSQPERVLPESAPIPLCPLDWGDGPSGSANAARRDSLSTAATGATPISLSLMAAQLGVPARAGSRRASTGSRPNDTRTLAGRLSIAGPSSIGSGAYPLPAALTAGAGNGNLNFNGGQLTKAPLKSLFKSPSVRTAKVKPELAALPTRRSTVTAAEPAVISESSGLHSAKVAPEEVAQTPDASVDPAADGEAAAVLQRKRTAAKGMPQTMPASVYGATRRSSVATAGLTARRDEEETAQTARRQSLMSSRSRRPSRKSITPTQSFARYALPLPQRLAGAIFNWFLFTYSSVLSATLKLLLCVPLPGTGQSFLFLNANQECTDSWRGSLSVLLACLCGFAVLLPLLMWRKKGWSGRYPGVYRVLTDPYREGCYWWECVLLAQRLLLSLFNTFLVHIPVMRLMLSGVVCIVASFLHLLYRPLDDTATQGTQTLLQFCLLVVVLGNTAVAEAVQEAQHGNTSSTFDTLSYQAVIDVAFVYVVPVAVACVRLVIGLCRQ